MTGDADAAVRVAPANEATWEDLQLVFGDRGPAAGCQCQRFKLQPKESFRSTPVEDLRQRLRDQTGCGDPGSPTTSGLVAYLDDQPVGWCAVEPRPAYQGLVRVFRVPWEGRDEDRTDTSVWAITCLFTRRGYRGRGISRALAKGAVCFARDRGAVALEGYPILTSATLAEELLVGSPRTFAEAGMREVHRPTLRRAVMRIDFEGPRSSR